MPKIGSKRSIKIPKGICDDLWRTNIHFGFSGRKIFVSKDDSFDKDQYLYLGYSYLDCQGRVSLPVDAISILDCNFGDVVLVYKSKEGIFIENPKFMHRQD